MRWIALCGIILVLAICAGGCTTQKSTQVTPVPTSETTTTPTAPVQQTVAEPTTAAVTPEPTKEVIQYVPLIMKGNAEVMLAKQRVQEGRDLFEAATIARGTAEQSVTVLTNSSAQFVEGSGHFDSALQYYNQALPLVPSGVKDSLALMISMLPDMTQTAQKYNATARLAMKGDWYTAGDEYNSINRHYEGMSTNLDQALVILRAVS